MLDKYLNDEDLHFDLNDMKRELKEQLKPVGVKIEVEN